MTKNASFLAISLFFLAFNAKFCPPPLQNQSSILQSPPKSHKHTKAHHKISANKHKIDHQKIIESRHIVIYMNNR